MKEKLKCIIFIPIVSQTYCDTNKFAWKNEFLVFKKKASEDEYGLKVKLSNGNVTSRIFPVRIHELDKADLEVIESELGPLRSVDFIYRSPGVNRPLLHNEDHPHGNLNKTYYRDQINKVANAIKDIMTGVNSPTRVAPGAIISTPSKVTQQAKTNLHKKWIVMMAITAIAVAGYFVYSTIENTGSKEKIDNSVAILPFGSQLEDADQKAFSTGIMEEIVSQLYKIESIKLVSLESSLNFKDSKLSPKEIAEQLGVSNILYLSVQKSYDRLKISCRLIDALGDRVLLSESYERTLTDIFSLQSEVAQKVVSHLKIKLTEEEKMRMPTDHNIDPDAYSLYLKAHELIWDGGWADKDSTAIKMLNKVIEMEPDFAPAYSELGSIWLFRGFFGGYLKAEDVTRKALPLLTKAASLDPNLAEAHAWMAQYFLWYEWDFKSAEREWQRVYEVSPSNTVLSGLSCDFLLASERPQEALALSLRNLEIDKTDVGNWIDLARSYLYLNQFDEALKTLNYISNTFEISATPMSNIIEIKVFMAKYDLALDDIASLTSLLPNDEHPRMLCNNALVYGKTGHMDKLELNLKRLIELSKRGSVGSPSFFIAQVYASLDNSELAFQWLEKSFRDHEVELYWLKVIPTLKSLHGDPRWTSLINRMPFTKK